MKNRLYIVAAAIVVGLVYLINAQEKPAAPPAGGEAAKPAAQVVQPATEPASVPAKPASTGIVEAVPVMEVPAPKPSETPAVPKVAEPAPVAASAPAMTTQPAQPTKPAEAEFVALPEKKETEIKGAIAQLNTNETLSIALDDVDMVDVIRMFTRLSKANIIVNPTNLTGKVTVNLADVEWRTALTSILDMHNLQLVERTPSSGVFSIVTKQPGAPEPLVVETLFLRYASVSNVDAVVKAMAPAPGSVSSFPSRNALVVRATSAQMSEIKTTLKGIDTMRDQVFIEAKFMELNDEAIKDLGINWQVLQGYTVSAGNFNMSVGETRTWDKSKKEAISQWDKRSNVDTLNKRYDINNMQYEESTTSYAESPPGSGNWIATTVMTPTRTVIDTIDKAKNITSDITDSFTKQATDVRAAVLGAQDFQLILSALKQMNGVTVVSNPKIMVANEEPAIIHIGQEERPFVSSVTPGQQGIAPVVTYNPGQPVQIGVKLTVTPTVNTESNITVRIEPELTRVLKDAVAPNGQTYPIVAKKTIKTVFCLESGKTVAIGGLTETDDRDKTVKIPLLGDIPLIGKYLFSHTSQSKAQTETIIFVTVGLAMPEAIQPETGLPEDTELTQRKMLESKLKRYKNRQELEKRNSEVNAVIDAESDKAKSRLLKMTK